jgi:methionyl-tRNA formyltransferase
VDLPKFGALNVHGSLLPKYRGASPIQAAILNGEKTTGVTLMLMDELLDHGPIFAQDSLSIEPSDTYDKLSDKLAKLSVRMLDKNLPLYLAGKIKPQPQKHEQATFTKIIKRECGLINWQKTAVEIERQLRAFTPWPGIYTVWQRKNQSLRLKITAVTPIVISTPPQRGRNPVGFVFEHQKNPAVTCGNGTAVILEKLQPAGGRVMTGKEFLNGYKDFIGSNLV